MNFAIIVFPGSNCDHDAYKVIEQIEGAKPKFVWHRDNDLSGYEDGLVGYWNINEGEGNILTDFSGNGNHPIIYKREWGVY